MTNSRRVVLVMLGLAVLVACCAEKPQQEAQPPLTDQLVMANLWMRSSAEYRALSHQSFNLATLRLDEALKDRDSTLPPAVVVDCDETVLATGRYGAWMITTGNQYEKATWTSWLAEDPAVAVPGATEFLAHAASSGVEVFYITNRYQDNNALTAANLASLGFPNADTDHVLAKTDTSDKSGRRAEVAEGHDIVLLLGDNLGDFDEAFQHLVPEERARQVDERAAEFGTRFIVLPNSTYGEWEKALYGYEKLNDEEKRARRMQALDPWPGPGSKGVS